MYHIHCKRQDTAPGGLHELHRDLLPAEGAVPLSVFTDNDTYRFIYHKAIILLHR